MGNLYPDCSYGYNILEYSFDPLGYFAFNVPARFTQVLNRIVFLVSSPDVLHRVA
jgi:hypothetical protein